MRAIDLAWPLRGSGLAGAAELALFLLLLLGSVPLGWYLIRRRAGRQAAGPLWVLLVFELLAGGYALFTPPWQMPDEPQHMVHVELVRTAGLTVDESAITAPVSTPLGSKRAAVQDEIRRSLLATDSNRWLPGGRPLLERAVIPGPSELPHPPLYYGAAATLTRPFGHAPVVARLAVVRVFGVVLACWTIWACGAVGRLLWPARKLAELPLVLAAGVPGFAAFAGGVNSDALVNLLAALLVLLCLAGVLERSMWARPLPWAAGLIGLSTAGVLTKRLFAPLLVVAAAAVVFRLRHRARALLAGAIGVELAVAVSLAAFWTPRLALWDGEPSPSASYRCPASRVGEWAICLDPGARVRQPLPLVRVRRLGGVPLTLGLWVRSSSPPSSLAVDLGTNRGVLATATFPARNAWSYEQLAAPVPFDPAELWVAMANQGKGRVMADDVRLAFDGTNTIAGREEAAGRLAARDQATNELTNGSGEEATAAVPHFLPGPVQRAGNSAIDVLARVFHEPGLVVGSTGIIAKKSAETFGMYWGTVGWQMPPPLLPVAVRLILGALVGLAVVGLGATLLRARLAGLGFLAVGAACVALALLARNVPPDTPEVMMGRYLFPGLAAQMGLLAAGLAYFWRWGDRGLRTAARLSILGLHAIFITFVFVPFLAGNPPR